MEVWQKMLFMLSYGFNKVTNIGDGYILADEYIYPISWLENDYIFFNKICGIKEV